VHASGILKGPSGKFEGDRKQFIEQVRQALYAAKICSYAQGFVQLQAASAEYDWNLNYGDCAMLWRGGCIIRAKFLDHIKDAFDEDPNLSNLLLHPFFNDAVAKAQEGWRNVVKTAITLGIPVPAFSDALAYYDGYRTANLPANLLQSQRDYFGAHTFKRTDREGTFHAEWIQRRREPQD
ncbi:MAG: NADP-dependent phosphogluconate dehydrogenase, partial [Pirellulaceae bacterium]